MHGGHKRGTRDVILARRALFVGAALGGATATEGAAAQEAPPAPEAESEPELVESPLPPQVCLSIVPWSFDRRGPAFALSGSLPVLVTLAEAASPYFIGAQLDTIFHYGISRLVDWRLAASGSALGGRDGAAGTVGGYTGVRLSPPRSPLLFGIGVGGGYAFLPELLRSDFVPVSSAYVAPYLIPIGAHFDALETELRVALWLSEQASADDTRFAPSFVHVGFTVGYGFYGPSSRHSEVAKGGRD